MSKLTYGEIQQLEYLAEKLGGKIRYFTLLDQSGTTSKKIVIEYEKQEKASSIIDRDIIQKWIRD